MILVLKGCCLRVAGLIGYTHDMKRFLILCVLAIPAHASTPITETFTVPMSYQAAYRLAGDFARTCHQSGGTFAKTNGFSVTGDLYTDIHEGIVRISATYISTKEAASIRVVHVTDDETKVTATVSGRGIWDQRELDALQKSMESGVITCRK